MVTLNRCRIICHQATTAREALRPVTMLSWLRNALPPRPPRGLPLTLNLSRNLSCLAVQLSNLLEAPACFPSNQKHHNKTSVLQHAISHIIVAHVLSDMNTWLGPRSKSRHPGAPRASMKQPGRPGCRQQRSTFDAQHVLQTMRAINQIQAAYNHRTATCEISAP